MATIVNTYTAGCSCGPDCPTTADVTVWSCGCVGVEIQNDSSKCGGCSDFTGMRESCGKSGHPGCQMMSVLLGHYVSYSDLILLLDFYCQKPRGEFFETIPAKYISISLTHSLKLGSVALLTTSLLNVVKNERGVLKFTSPFRYE